jgi:hypothetical protein
LGFQRLKLPAVCDVSVTNVCNAACDFCGFARDKALIGSAKYLDADSFSRALPILHRRGVRFVTLQGGEPLVHPEIARLVSLTAEAGLSCAVITNGWFLPRYIDALAQAGLSRLIVSIDSARLAEHERNRGLEGLERRLVEGIAGARARGLPVQASVTVSRLVDYDELPDTLRRLGFDDVSFSYPRREPFGSTSLVYGERSQLVDLDRDELLAALGAIGRLRKHFPVLNPRASLAEVARFVRGEPQAGAVHRRLQVLLSGLEPRHLALRGVERADGFGFRPRSYSRRARTLQCLHDGLLPQRQHADARCCRDHRCGAGPRGWSNRSRSGIALPAQRGAVAVGADRGGAEAALLGSSAETNQGRRRPPRRPGLERTG